jgi:hypothetical protein
LKKEYLFYIKETLKLNYEKEEPDNDEIMEEVGK